MKQTNPLLLIDFYKAVHDLMLPNKMTKSVSYGTPRMYSLRSQYEKRHNVLRRNAVPKQGVLHSASRNRI